MPLFEIKGFEKSFGNTQVLKGIDFSMEKGQVLAIIGSSGSGKTTLLRCINFLETPDKGIMYLNGEKLCDAETDRKMTDAQIRKMRLHFGLVFQNFNLFPQYTAFENICLAPKLQIDKKAPDRKKKIAEIDEKAAKLLENVGLADKKGFYPCQLSGGQQQRVAIARALILEPDILCFDEPTSALDPELTTEVLNVLIALSKQNTTMIIVTHEMEFAAEIADEIIFMDKGVVAARGTPDYIFGKSGNERLESFVGTLSKQ